MSRMMTRSQTIHLQRPKNQVEPVIKKSKIPTTAKSKAKSVKQKITSQIKQANDNSMISLKPKILIASFDLDLTKSIGVTDVNIMSPAGPDTLSYRQGTPKPVLDVLPMRRKTTDFDSNKKPISSRRKTISTMTPSLPVRRSDRIRDQTSQPVYFQRRKSICQEPAGLPLKIRNVNENLPSTLTTKISKRRSTKKSIDAQLKIAAKQKLAVHPPTVEITKVNEEVSSTSTTKISKRRYTKSVLNEQKKSTDAQPKTVPKQKLAVPLAVYASTADIPKVNEDLPSTSTTKISKRRYTKSVINELKEPSDVQQKTAVKRKLPIPLAAHPSPDATTKINENLPSTKISNRRQTIFVSNERTKLTKPAVSTPAYTIWIPAKTTDQLSAVTIPSPEIRKVNKNLPSTSMTAISKQRTTFVSNILKKPTTLPPPIQSTSTDIPKKQPNQLSAVHPIPNEVLGANENLHLISVRNILSTNAAQKSAIPTILIENLNENSPSLSDNKGEIEIIIPNELKTLLVNDVKIVTYQRKHYKIPATQSVANIIGLYVTLNQSLYQNESGFAFKQIFDNILEYFDALLGDKLLYESEHVRYLDVMNNFPDVKMSTLYPPIYLLRLFVKLNALMKFSCTDKNTLQDSVDYVNKFAKYLAANTSIFSDMNIFC